MDNKFAEKINNYFIDIREIYRRHYNENTDYTLEVKEYLDKIEDTQELCALHYYMNKIVLPALEDNIYDVFYFNEIGALISLTGLVIDSRPEFSNDKNNDERTRN